MANPAMAFFAFFVPCTKLKSILALTGVGTILSFFLLATALSSPGMLGGQSIGGTFTVIMPIFYFSENTHKMQPIYYSEVSIISTGH